MSLESFIGLPLSEDIDQQIAAQESIIRTSQEAVRINGHAEFVQLQIPSFPQGFNDLLSQTIDDIANNAERQIQEHFAAHNMSAIGASWIVRAIDHAENSCPFCGQGIHGLSLIAAYKSVYSDTYRRLRESINGMKTSIVKALCDVLLSRQETFIAQHEAKLEFRGQYCSIDRTALTYPETFLSSISSICAASLDLIEKKADQPLEAIAPDQTFLSAFTLYETEQVKLAALNQAIDRANSIIADKKAENLVLDVTAANTELNRLKAIKSRHTRPIDDLCIEYARLNQEKNAIETQKEVIREQLNQQMNSVIASYQSRINELLDAFNAGFTITETTHSYRGGSATSTYQLVINQTPIDIGGSSTPNHTHSFKNTLSAGDRSTLALAFFLANLESDPAIANKIIVFDDPFNSKDAFRRRQTIHEIIKLARACAQVIVLSHDAHFLKQIWEKCQPAERSALNIADHGANGTKIAEFDLERACQGRTAIDLDDLQAYFTHGTGQHIDIIRKMRTVLETHMRSTYPAYFTETDWLGEMVGKIRNGGRTHPAYDLYDALNEINDYTSEYHHGESVADSTSDTIDSTELRGFTKRTLRVVNAMQA